MKLPVFVALLFLAACGPKILMPNLKSDGRWQYEEGTVAEKHHQTIPTPLLNDSEFSAQARNCAVAYNQARSAYNRCFATSSTLRIGQLASAGVTVLSSGIGPNTSNDVVKRRWSHASVAGAAALALFTGFDFWLNCNDRTFVEQALAAQRLAHLNNASHLLMCAKRAREQRELIERLHQELESLGQSPTKDDALNRSIQELRSKQDINLHALKRFNAQVGTAKNNKKLSTESKTTIDNISSTSDQLIRLIPTLCAPPQSSDASTQAASRPQDYLDRVHAELVQCLQVNPVRFNVEAATR
ncbi:hypothetical protein HUW63_07615 [Myxococcus sp. AM001]|nr:hypothetical protein [Myxococcus sp. AM001]